MKKLNENNSFVTNCALHKTDSGANILSPFGPLVYQCEVSDDITNYLLNEGSKLNIQNDDYRDKLAGNMKTGCSYNYKKEDKNYISKKLSPYINDFFNSVSKIKGPSYVDKTLSPPVIKKTENGDWIRYYNKTNENTKLKLDSLWINYQKSGDFNPAHTHFGVLSFVIFLDVPQRIFNENIVKTNSNYPGQLTFSFGENIGTLSGCDYNVKPYKNLMFVFEAQLRHSVMPFWTDDTRVSVSGNYVFAIDNK